MKQEYSTENRSNFAIRSSCFCWWNERVTSSLSSTKPTRVHRDAGARSYRRKELRYSGHLFPSLSLYLLALVLVVSVQPSAQVLEFLSEPAPYYYTRPGFITYIPCEAVHSLPDGTQVLSNATFFRNSTPIYPDTPRHITVIDSQERVEGVLILPTVLEDSMTVYRCRVEEGGVGGEETETLVSQDSILYVGAGIPFPPVETPYQLSETAFSVNIEWGFSPAPISEPILNYTLTYWPRNQSRDVAVTVGTPDNETNFDFVGLSHNSEYSVVVQGRNSLGLGGESRPGMFTTALGESPPAPSDVDADVLMEDVEGVMVNVTWTAPTIDPAIMSPIDSYIIFVNSSSLDFLLVVSTLPSSTFYNLTLQESGVYSVGIAAMNSIGQSDVSYIREDLDIIVPVPQATIMTTVTTETPETDSTPDSNTTPQTTDSSTTPQISDSSTTPQTTNSSSTPQTTDSSSTPQTTDSSTTPQISDSSTMPQTTDSSTTPQISDSSTTPQTTDSSSTPQATDSSFTPQTTDSIPGSNAQTTDSTPDSTISITQSPRTGSLTTITVVGVVVAASIVLVLLSGLIFLLIFYVRTKIRSLGEIQEESPSSKRKSYLDKEDNKDTVVCTSITHNGVSNSEVRNNEYEHQSISMEVVIHVDPPEGMGNIDMKSSEV